MKARNLCAVLLAGLLCGCAATVDVESMLQDYDGYNDGLKLALSDPQAIELLDGAEEKRAEAGALFEEGKKRDAVPLVNLAMADARLAVEMDRMSAAARRAEQCRVGVGQARTKWEEALYVLEKTEEFTGTKGFVSKDAPASIESPAEMPASVLGADGFPPAAFADASAQWQDWRGAAVAERVAVAELETAVRRSRAAMQVAKVDSATTAHHSYLVARAAQTLECRVRTQANEQVCVGAARMIAEFGDARDAALRATLDLERGLQDDLRGELDQLRAEAKTRQDELFDALSQMEGKFASIRRDARGTIVSLADILFDFDKATLRRDVEFNLVKIATILNQFGEMSVLIEGHTDSIGSEDYNLKLSERRAKAVYEFLVSQDVVAERLSFEGYGESRPVADNETDEGRQQNRRVDLVIQDAPE